ncbi:MAG TPA: helix-turn-helix domain-containing protein [bacterium]|nr:helix-turn-helix domain-containing protein [bacterium]HPP29331.1 helix-turn-helix domain-containing protein [bacterium]
MESIQINEVLKEKRIKEGITLEQVFYEAHIPSKFVRMIEDGEWEKFPSELHMKGFIRLYGNYLKIPASVVEEGIRAIEKKKEEAKKQDETEEKKKEDRAVPERYLYLLLILLVIFVTLYFLILYLLPE